MGLLGRRLTVVPKLTILLTGMGPNHNPGRHGSKRQICFFDEKNTKTTILSTGMGSNHIFVMLNFVDFEVILYEGAICWWQACVDMTYV